MDRTDRFTIALTTDSDEIVGTAAGEIDPVSGPRLEGEVRAALFASPAKTLVLDLADVTFLDSSGLRVLLDLHKTMRERDGRLVLRHPSATVSRLLEITDLTASLDIEPSPADPA
jgi:anti-sigma B factor antagonist